MATGSMDLDLVAALKLILYFFSKQNKKQDIHIKDIKTGHCDIMVRLEGTLQRLR